MCVCAEFCCACLNSLDFFAFATQFSLSVIEYKKKAQKISDNEVNIDLYRYEHTSTHTHTYVHVYIGDT